MNIRLLGMDDLAIAAKIIQQVKLTQVVPEHITKFLQRSDHYFIAGTEEGKPLGFALAYELQRIDGAPAMLFLYEIGVVKAYRRHGVAKAMICCLKRICHEKGMLKMFVVASDSNIPAVRLYDSTFGEAHKEASVVYAIPTNT